MSSEPYEAFNTIYLSQYATHEGFIFIFSVLLDFTLLATFTSVFQIQPRLASIGPL